MFNVDFYEFNKRHNSTKRPTAGTPSATFACTMKSPSSLTSPIIELKLTGSQVPKYNYCFIRELGSRYYFIERTYYDMGLWLFQLSVDVLATYYDDIRGSSQFILRSATNSELYLIDNAYPLVPEGAEVSDYAGIYIQGQIEQYAASGQVTGGGAVWDTGYFKKTLNQGDVVIGVKGNNTTGVTYYRMSTQAFNFFVYNSFSINPSMSTDTTSAFANAVYDPLQYLVSARWYPSAPVPSDATQVSSIKLGGDFGLVNLGTYRADRVDGLFQTKWSCLVDIPRHPLANTYPYMMMEPYTQMSLYMQPFGMIPLDTVRLVKASDLQVSWIVDYRTGTSALELSDTSAAEDNVFYANTYPYGVDLPISTLVADWRAAALGSGLQYIKTALNGGGKNKPADVLAAEAYVAAHPDEFEPGTLQKMTGSTGADLVDKMSDAIVASMGKVQSVGGVGSFLGYTDFIPKIYSWYYSPSGMDIARFGQPYGKQGNMTAESGFVLCQNASVNYSVKQPLPVESTAVVDYLNTGIFME